MKMKNFEIAAGLTEKGSFLFVIRSEDEMFEIREETFFYLKEDLKFEDISDRCKIVSATFLPELNLTLWRKYFKFKDFDQAKKSVLDLMAEEMKIRGNIISDKNSLYLELLKTKERIDELSEKFISLSDKVDNLDSIVHYLDVNSNGPGSY